MSYRNNFLKLQISRTKSFREERSGEASGDTNCNDWNSGLKRMPLFLTDYTVSHNYILLLEVS